MAAKLTAAACRAARALLNWTVRDLMREAGVSPNTVTSLEAGKEVRPETEARIVETFAKVGVEITNGDGTGARLLEIRPHRRDDGEWAVFESGGGRTPGRVILLQAAAREATEAERAGEPARATALRNAIAAARRYSGAAS